MKSTAYKMEKYRKFFLQWAFPVVLSLIAVAVSFERNAYCSEEIVSKIPDRYGMALSYGYCIQPADEVAFALATVFGMYGLDKIWDNRALDLLRVKAEISLGSSYMPDDKFMVSINIAGVYYLDKCLPWKTENVRPYIDFGAGGIYTDFRIPGQGLRLNFNPIVSIGTEFKAGSGPPCFVALRWSHVSNCETKSENKGINSLMFMLGRFF